MDSFEHDSAVFLDWFGTRVSDKIRVADHRAQGSGRAVVATQDITEDEELFAVPRTLVLQPQTSSLSTELASSLPDSDPWLPLIITIIYELLRGNHSPWVPYLHLLPSTFDSLMFWSQEELTQLKGSAVVNKIGREAAEVAWRHTIIPFMLEHPNIFPTNGQSKEQKEQELVELAHRAGSLIMAYAFDIDNDDDNNEALDGQSDEQSSLVSDDEDEQSFKGMVPFADLLNADADRNNAKLFQEDDYLIMKATAAIKAGEEIFNDYGPLPRSDLLRMYGYITPNYAQYDVVEVVQEDIMACARNNKKDISDIQQTALDTLNELGVLEDAYIIQRSTKDISKLMDAIPAELHMLLRALTCNLGNDSSSNEKHVRKAAKEDVTIEEASLLSAVCMKRLTDYGTTIEEDGEVLDRLQQSPRTPEALELNISPRRLQMAVEVRKGEKEILNMILNLCQKHITEKTSALQAAGTATKRKHHGEEGRVTEKDKAAKKSKKQGFR